MKTISREVAKGAKKNQNGSKNSSFASSRLRVFAPSREPILMSENLPKPTGEFLLYQTEDGRSRIECRLRDETLWLSLNQISELFDRDKSVISKHLKNIFEEGELARDSVVAQNATTAADGKNHEISRDFMRFHENSREAAKPRSREGAKARRREAKKKNPGS